MTRQLLLSCFLGGILSFAIISLQAGNRFLDDPYALPLVKQVEQDTVPPIQDRYGDFVTDPNSNPFDLADPSAVDKTVEFDPETGQYIVRETIGETLFRPPTFISFDEYLEMSRQQEQRRYFQQLAGFDKTGGLSVDDPLAGVDVGNSLLDRLFGGTEISIKPQGSIDLNFGFDYQYVENPILTQRQKRNGGFDFDMAIQMNVTGQIGEKLKLNTNYNTQATFNFDNQIKLDYNSDNFGEDDILKKIEAGNVSLPLRGTLIQGAQSLFGLKTELQFGHLRLTAIASQQQSENETITIQGGSQVTEFEVKSDDYDENRHFFLSHYNRSAFEPALRNLPQMSTLFHLENLEIWITNDQNQVENTRDIVAFADLGEPERLTNPQSVRTIADPRYREICDGLPLPENGANDLFGRVVARDDMRDLDRAVAVLQSEFGMTQGRDFEKVRARKLNSREYTVHPELGFISINIPVQQDQVLAVSFRYKYNGEVFRVGELATNTDAVDTDSTVLTPKVLYTKLLKSTTQAVGFPTWDLMMKNVYSIGAYQVNQEDFRLDVFYEDPGRGVKRFLPDGLFDNKPLIRVFNLDRLNVQNDPQPDGVFDFVPGVTINPQNGRIIFPVLEPFGSFLDAQISDPILKEKYVYQELYDQTPFNAREFPQKNRYVIKGSYKSSVASEISLGAFNIPQGSVRVSAGRQLEEGVDYEIDYSTGRLRILNDAILSSGVPINVSFEDNTVFGLQNKTMLGLRADYEVSDDVNIGGTFLQLFERPFTPKVNAGDDPINNRIYGLDFTMNKEAPFLTRLVDKLPFYSTTEPSSISVLAETAVIDPGHARAINQTRRDKSGIVYVDDFEGSASAIDLRQPTNQWFLASVPQNNIKFPEARESGLVSGANRARLNWYLVDPQVREDRNATYTGVVPQTEVFPNRNVTPNQRADIQVFDLSYYPNERGPYNFDEPGGLNGLTSGVQLQTNDSISPVQLNDPETRWGGVMRALTTNDFQSANIEFLEFWMLSPFHDDNNPRDAATDIEDREGNLYINLGNVSEDILKDSQRFFENGLPGPANRNRRTVNTNWGRVPVGQQITRAFDNDPATRTQQDVGLDGLSDAQEASFYSEYLGKLTDVNAQAAAIVANDVSNDNFQFFTQYPSNTPVRERYRKFNNPQGNSGANNDNVRRQSGTNIPDAEDLDRDNTLNETESYFEYQVRIKSDPADPRAIDRDAARYVTDVREADNGRLWYRFRIPIRDRDEREAIGGIQDFRSIRFMRMYLKDFDGPTTLRFATLDLVRSQWRRYTQDISNAGQNEQDFCNTDENAFQVDAVNIEENSSKLPFNYTLPVGIIREQTLGVFQALQNEQSLALRLDNLCDGAAEGVFKYTEQDMRLYERLQLFLHAEERDLDARIPDGALTAFVRLGSDFTDNYYEYEIPLKISRPEEITPGQVSAADAYKRVVWPDANLMDFPLADLRKLKEERNGINFNAAAEFIDDAYSPPSYDSRGNIDTLRNSVRHTIKVKGNPNLGFVKVMMIGVRNPKSDEDEDFLQSYSVELWANELRLVGLDERMGVAGLARVDMQLADLGAVTLAGNYSSVGFGGLDAGVHDRSREQLRGYDLALDLNLDKFLPERWGLRVPFYAQRSNTTTTPEYDPYDLDIKLQDKLDQAEDANARDSIRQQAQEIVNITTYNFNNVSKQRTGGGGESKPKPWDVENFSVSYGYTRTERSDPLIANDVREEYTGGLNYGYSRSTKYIEPFKGLKPKSLRIIKELNLNPLPNSFNFSTILDRQFTTTSYRFAGVEERFNTFFNKRFNWNRNYDLNWDITRSLKFNFNANSIAAIDEPDEIAMLEDPSIIDRDQFRRDSIWTNIRSLGRPKLYEHGINISYSLPIRYLPYMDWVQVRAQYQGGYSWNAASLNVDSLGNVIQNRQQRQITGDFNFDKLYDQIGFLKKYNRPVRRGRASSSRSRNTSRGQEKKDEDDSRSGRTRSSRDVNPTARALIRPLLMLRKVRISYSEQFNTVVPGFTPETELLGLSSGFDAPGWGFVAGLQPKIRVLEEQWYGQDDWLYQNREWITPNVFMNQDVVQEYSQNFEGRLTIEPFDDFRVEVEANRTFTENYTESFKVFDKEAGAEPLYEHRVPTYGGQLSLSYNAMSTMFRNDSLELQELLTTMQGYRRVISQRLGSTPHRDPALAAQGFTDGYGRNQQDVLLPAFVAAYTGQDPNTIDLDLFNTRFRPNWRVTYGGLSRLPAFRDILSSFNISHSYRSTFTISNYRTGLDYLATRQEDLNPGLDTVSFNLFPRIEIPDVVITDNFGPLIAIEAQFQNGMSIGFDYQSSRNVAMSVVSKLLTTTHRSEMTGTFGYVLSGVNIGFLTGKKRPKGAGRREEEPSSTAPAPGRGRGGRSGSRLEPGNLDMQFSFSYADDITIAQTIDDGASEPTRGNLSISLSPSAEYQLNDRMSLRAFVDYRRTIPKNSAGFARTDASGGIVVRFQLN